jgi:hypothetical protein
LSLGYLGLYKRPRCTTIYFCYYRPFLIFIEQQDRASG